jgi:hypothetical protein
MRRARKKIGTYIQDVRRQRQQWLKDTDWTQVPDSPLSDTKKAEWATWRQAMRDFPANVGSYNETDDYINFPDPPDYAGDGSVDATVPTPTPPPE